MSVECTISEIKSKIMQRGEVAIQNVRKHILATHKDDNKISQALRHFSTVTLKNALPVFPALISISCEAVDGERKNTIPFGEAIMLISAAADLHDDVIDNSTKKNNRLTVFGKFGSTITILAGDILLADGIKRLNEACYEISNEKSNKIMKMTSDAIFEICCGEALERKICKTNLSLKKYNEVIKLKAVVPELTIKMGAIIGQKGNRYVEELGQFGRSYGVISLIVEEFADLLEIDELRNRLRYECPPLPFIYAFQDKKIKEIINQLIGNQEIDKSLHKQIVEIILASKEVIGLEKTLVTNAKSAIQKLPNINKEIKKELENMLLVPLSFF